MLNIYLITFGCKVNYYETEALKSLFIKDGHNIVNDFIDCDVAIINSCTVTASGDSKMLSTLKKIRKKNPNAIIALAGCYPQAFPEKAQQIDIADIVTGTKNLSDLSSMIYQFSKSKNRLVNIQKHENNDEFENLSCTVFPDNTRAFVKIQDGCNCFCSYCIIPYSRGRCRSKSIENLKIEAQAIADNGIKEIVLSGINLAFFGKEFGLNLADAVETCCSIKGIERVRLGSLEPEMLTDDILSRFKAQEKFCSQFHLSLQSGCSRTLKAMNRRYSAEEYLEITQKIRNIFPECNFTTDIMVGFPDETDEDFQQSLDFVKKIGFGKIHVFRYSVREGTPAATFKNQIPENIKSERWHKMNELALKSQSDFLHAQIGKVVSVLFERENCTDFHCGHAPDYAYIKISEKNFKKSLRNSIFYVKIIGSDSDHCIGEIIK